MHKLVESIFTDLNQNLSQQSPQLSEVFHRAGRLRNEWIQLSSSEVISASFSSAISSTLKVTINNLPVFKGDYSIVVLQRQNQGIIISYADQNLSPEAQEAFTPNLLLVALKKAMLELSSQELSDRPSHNNPQFVRTSGFPHHAGTATVNNRYLGISGAFPTPEMLTLIGCDPQTSLYDYPHLGFFDHLFATEVARRLSDPSLPTNIATPAYLRWILNGRLGTPSKAIPFHNFNQ